MVLASKMGIRVCELPTARDGFSRSHDATRPEVALLSNERSLFPIQSQIMTRRRLGRLTIDTCHHVEDLRLSAAVCKLSAFSGKLVICRLDNARRGAQPIYASYWDWEEGTLFLGTRLVSSERQTGRVSCFRVDATSTPQCLFKAGRPRTWQRGLLSARLERREGEG